MKPCLFVGGSFPRFQRIHPYAFLLQALLLCLALSLIHPAWAESPASATPTVTVTVADPWIRATTTHQKATGAFMQLTSKTPATLVKASSPVAGVVEIHEMATENNVMSMRAIPQLQLPAGQMVALKPGGYHIMLMDLKAPLTTGQKVPLTLTVQESGAQPQEIKLEVEVRPLNSGAMPKH